MTGLHEVLCWRAACRETLRCQVPISPSLHALQAMFVSFGMAEHRGGHCYLRFDDTNPEAEKQEYIDHIREIVSWMGWTPFKVMQYPLSHLL